MATGRQADNWQEEYVEYQCSVCETKSKVKNADNFCFDCLKYLCNTCLSYHNTLLEAHKVLPLDEDTIPKILTEKCEQHPDKLIEYICQNHDAIICSTCREQDHK